MYIKKFDYQTIITENEARVLDYQTIITENEARVLDYQTMSAENKARVLLCGFQSPWEDESQFEYSSWIKHNVATALEIIRQQSEKHYRVLELAYIPNKCTQKPSFKLLPSQLGMTPKIYRRIRNEAMQRFLDLCPVDEAPFPESPTIVDCKLKPGPRHS